MRQPIPKISDKLLEKLIFRDFPNDVEEVKRKLNAIVSDNQAGKRRLSAAILKLANEDLTRIDNLVEKCNYDFRDIVCLAEYPDYSKNGFGNYTGNKSNEIYTKDWAQYSAWLNK